MSMGRAALQDTSVHHANTGRSMTLISRRQVLAGAAGSVGLFALGGCGEVTSVVTPRSAAVRGAEAARRAAGQRTITGQLTPRPVTLDLGGPIVRTWGYGEHLPGPLLRAKAGDQLRIVVDNQLPTETSIHWHGIALRNDMDGVPGITQDAISAGKRFTYEFTAPDPGTYFYHPHVGVQLDRGLYGVLLIDDPADEGSYDNEWTVVLDDWIDGTGETPDQVLASLLGKGQESSGSNNMPGMSDGASMSGMGESLRSPILGGAGDISYPHYLANGRVPAGAETFHAKPGQKIRLRLINAGSDTAFRVALAGHQLTVTHTDGYPVRPVSTDALMIGMGERFDVEVTAADGVFPLVASAEGKSGQALAYLRTGAGRAPDAAVNPSELNRRVLLGNDLRAADAVRLGGRRIDRVHTLVLGGAMSPYRWTINGKAFPNSTPLPVTKGQRVRLRMTNHSMMFHPMHLHGHTFAASGGGARKDTIIVRPMQTVEVDFDATNPGQWATHCHNIYHAERGMMTTLSYRS
jgi:FtsP/CotA-like multicopper oxidase with cupredoxin domain